MIRRVIPAAILAIGLAGCMTPPPPPTRSVAAAAAPGIAAEELAVITVPDQPPNVGDAGTIAFAYHDSGAYARDLAIVGAQAARRVTERAPQVPKPAVVFDIDETALSNWRILQRDDLGRPIPGPCNLASGGPCGWAAWDQLALDPAIQPTLAVFLAARAAGAATIFITGRPENQRAATERNLAAAGYRGYTRLYMVPDGARFASAADFKAPIRVALEQEGYTIIVNIGDQPSDLAGGHAERRYQLPDPFYRVP